MAEVPAQTDKSDAVSAALRERGFKFVGSVICYAFMQAAGLVNDHLVTCFRHRTSNRLQPPTPHPEVDVIIDPFPECVLLLQASDALKLLSPTNHHGPVDRPHSHTSAGNAPLPSTATVGEAYSRRTLTLRDRYSSGARSIAA